MKKVLFTMIIMLFIKSVSGQLININWQLFCVDSVWYEPGNQLINVRIQNNDTNFINYPSVQIVSPQGDTISNVFNTVYLFGQIPGTSTIYTDTIIDSTITDFSNYTFIMSQGFGESRGVISTCFTSSLKQITIDFEIYPNPADEILKIRVAHPEQYRASIKTLEGKIFSENNSILNEIDVSNLTEGIYLLELNNGTKKWTKKFVK